MGSETYYMPPAGWRYQEVFNRYRRLARTYRLKDSLDLDYEYDSDLVNLKYALWDISGAIKRKDKASIEIAIDLVLSDVYFHYSGYIRATMARRLKSAGLSETEKERLRRGLFNIFMSGSFGPEYKEFAGMLRKFGLGSMECDYKRLWAKGGKQQKVAQKIFGSNLTNV